MAGGGGVGPPQAARRFSEGGAASGLRFGSARIHSPQRGVGGAGPPQAASGRRAKGIAPGCNNLNLESACGSLRKGVGVGLWILADPKRGRYRLDNDSRTLQGKANEGKNCHKGQHKLINRVKGAQLKKTYW